MSDRGYEIIAGAIVCVMVVGAMWGGLILLDQLIKIIGL